MHALLHAHNLPLFYLLCQNQTNKSHKTKQNPPNSSHSQLGTEEHTYNPSIWEAEARRSLVGSRPTWTTQCDSSSENKAQQAGGTQVLTCLRKQVHSELQLLTGVPAGSPGMLGRAFILLSNATFIPLTINPLTLLGDLFCSFLFLTHFLYPICQHTALLSLSWENKRNQRTFKPSQLLYYLVKLDSYSLTSFFS